MFSAIVGLSVCLSFPQSAEPFGQGGERDRLRESAGACAQIVFEGFVVEPEGAPAAGAVVVSSAGGRTVTDRNGSFRLEVPVPLGATMLRVTARGADGRGTASESVELRAVSGTARVETLVLSQPTGCRPSWLTTFGEYPGTDPYSEVRALAELDDGNGSALYAAGRFSLAGGVVANHVAKWNGSSWSAVGSGLDDVVDALAVYDDGRGPALYAGGSFTGYVAKWNGWNWERLAGGMGAPVEALAVYDDGSGPALYAGGRFTTAGGIPASCIAKWNGSTWESLGGGVGGTWPQVYQLEVAALTVHDDGSGPALFVGGDFAVAGDVAASCVAKWDGSTWAALGSGTSRLVQALCGYDDGSGPALYAGGTFTQALEKWDGTSWTVVNGLTPNAKNLKDVEALTVYDGGSGPALYVGGSFWGAGINIARWNGSGWTGLLGGTSLEVRALAVCDDGSGPALYAGGDFEYVRLLPGELSTRHVARWNGSAWSPLGSGAAGEFRALTAYDGCSEAVLCAGGRFGRLGGVEVNSIATWNGTSWSSLGGGLTTRASSVGTARALAVFDDGSGTALYAGGNFANAGGVPADGIAKWSGSGWAALGSGLVSQYGVGVSALAVYDDGGGPALFVGGQFSSAGGVAVDNIAKWDGSSWSALGGTLTTVGALTVFDDGSGPALYASGNHLSSGGNVLFNIARWDGSSWTGLANGVDDWVFALTVYDDGSGPALYAGGEFVTAGGVVANGIAKWDGSSWSALGSGVDGEVDALTVYDDGSGPALYAGGTFTHVNGLAANRIARWDGASWTALGSGTSDSVDALEVFDDGSGPALFAGGTFQTAYDSCDATIAKWGYPLDVTPPTLSCPAGVLETERPGSPPGEVVTFSVTASDCRDPAPNVVCTPPSGSFFAHGTTLVTCTATDASGNQATRRFQVVVTGVRGLTPH